MSRTDRDDLWLVVCLGAVVILAAVDLGAGRDVNLTGTMAFAPFLASAVCSRRRTAMVSATSLGVGLLLLWIDTVSQTEVVVRASVLGAACLLGPAVAASRARRERKLQQLIQVAEVAQLAVLTPVPAVAGPVALSTAYRSASREALIGGDLYAVVECGEAVRILVGDVRGKGLDSVQLAAIVLSVFREAALAHASLVDVAQATDERLSPHLHGEDFVTAVFADIGPQGQVDIVSCGHPAPVLVDRSSRRLLDIADPAAPLGLAPQPVSHGYRLRPGDRLLFYTDGLIEARARSGGFVDLDDLLKSLPTDPTDVALDRIITRLHAAAGEVRDDLALLLAEFVGTPAAVDGSAA